MAEKPATSGCDYRVAEFRELFNEFLGGRVNLEMVLRAVGETIDAAPNCASSLQACLDESVQAGQLPEQTWERLTAEIDHMAAAAGIDDDVDIDEDTEWSEEAPASSPSPQLAGLEAEDTNFTAAGSDRQPPAPEEREEVLSPGTLLANRYVIVARIEAGSMGFIYKALDRHRKDTGDEDPWVAIKVVGPRFTDHPMAAEALENEARLCRSLDHPNIVRLLDFTRADDRYFISMEWLDGDSLRQVLNGSAGKPLPAAQCERIVRSLADALGHAHSRGVVHADVKPGNVFVSRDGHVKLLDFGIARAASAVGETFDAAALGGKTPAYASCEVLEGAPATASDDLFSLAVLAYRLWSGQRPFDGQNALAAETADASPSAVPGLQPNRWSALRAALSFRAEHRQQSVQDFAQEFFAAATTHHAAPAAPAKAPAEPRGRVSTPPASAQTAEPGGWNMPSGPVMLGLAASAAALVAALGLLRTGSDGVPTDSAPPTAAGNQSEVISGQAVPATAGNAARDVRSPAEADDRAVEPLIVAANPSDSLAAETDLALITPRTLPGSESAPAPATADAPVEEARDDSAENTVAEAGESDTVAGDRAEPATRIAATEAQPNGLAPTAAEPVSTAAVSETALARDAEADAPGQQVLTPLQVSAEIEPADPAGNEAERRAESAIDASVADSSAGPLAAPQRPPANLDAAPTTEGDTLVASTQALSFAASSALDPAVGGRLAETGPPAPLRKKPEPSPSEIGPAAPAGPLNVELSELEFENFVEPRFPRRLQFSDRSGWVEVRFRVDRSGATTDIEILDAEPGTIFNTAALVAVRKWRFKPMVVDGEAVESITEVRLRFEP